MDIIWHGYSCFTIKTKEAVVVANPYMDGKGLKLPNLKGDIAVLTGVVEGHDNLEAVKGEPYKIDWPGEYEVKEAAVTAFPSPNGKGFFFNLLADGLKVCLMENVGKDLNDELIDKIGDVDVLLLSVGGHDVMDAEAAHKVIEEIEPRAVIPMHYKAAGVQAELNDIESFLKVAGINNAETQEKFSLGSKSQLKEDQTEYILLAPQTA